MQLCGPELTAAGAIADGDAQCHGRQVLERGQEISKRDWRVVRVAIVELRQQTYIGRLFFGDDAGVVMWDCDCRPSDGCWLALKVWASPSARYAQLQGIPLLHVRGLPRPAHSSKLWTSAAAPA